MNTQSLENEEKNTKQKILDAALDLIAEHGYSKASVRMIAKAVGIRESAIYNHFANKDEIFSAIAKQLFTTPFDDFFEKKPPSEYAKKGKRYLLEYVSTVKLISFDQKYEKLFRIILQELMKSSEIRKGFIEHFFKENIKNLSSAFFIMMQEGLIRSNDPIVTAQEFFAPLLYYRVQITLFRLENMPTNALSSIFEKHVDFFWESIML
ncbi:TetR/AcrR family transcriptional regulator [Nitratiruptor sp. SB155-2]|uniref:TetR/AcrR family transcriptional regulator n=1 Tax=Nitratiruptor sp. (strain SB155-2) TaxID=387092 RepID=UPI000158725B|nr:TetR/AcrR family transcriptional regulator [Nitratiruptor sp. SB155-2]BAF70090.1 transcriptional regulator, TetR family [Nitratiruptor sp. SB155-2]